MRDIRAAELPTTIVSHKNSIDTQTTTKDDKGEDEDNTKKVNAKHEKYKKKKNEIPRGKTAQCCKTN